jgi:peptidoglycan/LPS O-acetylase OafA/YrhL
VAFGLIGGLVGISVAMLFLNDPEERVHVYLDNSLPLFFCGLIVGCMIGVLMMTGYEDRPRARRTIEVAAFALLCAAVAAPSGWIVGELRFPRMSEKGMGVAAAGGFAFGLLIGAIRRHRPEPESTQS